MAKKPLIETNPHLRDSEEYEKLLIVNVTSSTAVEIGKLPPALLKALKNNNLPLLIKTGDQKSVTISVENLFS